MKSKESLVKCNKELPIDMDLSETAVEYALDLLHDKYSMADCSLKWGYLNVPSQTIGTALLIARKLDLSVRLNIEYQSDEWSLTLEGWGPPAKRYDLTIHSYGA